VYPGTYWTKRNVVWGRKKYGEKWLLRRKEGDNTGVARI
jgi:hypothetical protein